MLMPPEWRPPVLTGRRIVLRAFTPDDIAPLFAIASNPKVARYTLWEAHRSLDDTALFVWDYAIARYREGEFEPYAISLRPETRPIGAVGCHWVSRPNCTMELGYWIAEQHWGRGLVCEAVEVLLAYVEYEIQPERIQAKVIVGNDASVRVLEKCGFRFEGTLRSSLFRRGKFEDVMMFAKVRPPENSITPATVPG